ncbi:LysR family transcriptional regulator [Paraburkholderia sp. Tr-20389]|uniref:LysR family transcriptional regulator n=1 Tax=Paraburkholderia sp. Tr-20389 TaxID=2703903 RepID=UPI00198150CD|nr:LysR family transcriptional regulator [Paraburkholderia sp. Tr-20389]MBN3753766.1 LysR family transcriptional regulator [Paraburkholderia sp. Tr-20389]
MDRFEAMSVYVRVVEAGSLSAAARAIPMSLTSVSRHIAALEEQFSAQLLRRTTRNLAMTDEGRILYDRAKSILGDVDELGSALSAGRGKLSGRLRIAAPNLLGRLLIAPLLPRFLAMHPEVAVDLMLVDRVVNVVEEGLHLAVRVGRLPDSSLVARKLDDIEMVVCAAPSYLAQRGTPGKPDELRQHDCLVFSDAAGPVDWRFQSGATRTRVSVTGRLWMNSLDALVSAALEGAGIVRAPAWQVAAHIDAGRLQRVLDRFAPPATPVHVLFERTKLASPKIRTFVDYLVDRWGRV